MSIFFSSFFLLFLLLSFFTLFLYPLLPVLDTFHTASISPHARTVNSVIVYPPLLVSFPFLSLLSILHYTPSLSHVSHIPPRLKLCFCQPKHFNTVFHHS